MKQKNFPLLCALICLSLTSALSADPNTTDPYQQLFDEVVKQKNLSADMADLRTRFKKRIETPNPERLAVFDYLFTNPFQLEPFTEKLIAQINTAPDSSRFDLRQYLNTGYYLLEGFNKTPIDDKTLFASIRTKRSYRHGSLGDHLTYIETVLAQAKKLNEKALEKLTPEEIKFVLDNRLGLLERFTARYDLPEDEKKKAIENNRKLASIMLKLDYQSLFKQAYLTSKLLDHSFIRSLKLSIKKASRSEAAGIIARKDTPSGQIVIAGTADNRHTNDYAVLIDLGGDDMYFNNQASSSYPKIPSSIIIDLSGNDTYESTTPFTQAAGSFGTGILADLDGDDSYVGQQFTQAISFGGIGILLDNAGSDTYKGLDMNQAVAHWGFALLIDSKGKDSYESHIASQAAGLPKGIAILADYSTDPDNYYCTGGYLSSYKTKGTFEGWSQGTAFGYRSSKMPGGFALLYDQGGNDKMKAGNFSQGCGYYFGTGILYADGSEDDYYIGSRYAQGCTAHQAIGALIEKGGDDTYKTVQSAAQAIAWDESLTVFIEHSGNDTYLGGPFSQGASAQNGWMLFYDKQGDDKYKYTDQAQTDKNEYHGGKSIAYFVDTQGNDTYPKKKNNKIETFGNNSVFIDLPTTIDLAIKSKTTTTLLNK